MLGYVSAFLHYCFNFFTSLNFLVPWILINGLLAFYIRKQLLPYYDPKVVNIPKHKNKSKNKENQNEEIIATEVETESVNIHDQYPEFNRHDKLPSFLNLWFASATYMWIKVGLWVLFLSIIWLDCK